MFNFYKKLFKMAKKRKSRKRGLSAAPRVVTKRRRARRKKGGLSEMFTASTAQASVKTMAGGAMGGAAYGLLEPALNANIQDPLMRGGLVLGASFAASALLNMPNISAGIAGAYVAGQVKKLAGLGEMEETAFADEEALNEEPEYLDEAGNPMFLAADGNFYYLEEMEEMEEMEEDDFMNEEEPGMNDPMFLADDFRAGFYPEYVNTSRY